MPFNTMNAGLLATVRVLRCRTVLIGPDMQARQAPKLKARRLAQYSSREEVQVNNTRKPCAGSAGTD